MVNNFNIFLMLLVNSNTDLQFLASGNSGLSIIHYITNYITKNSFGMDSLFILQRAALASTLENPLHTAPNSFNENQAHIRDFFIRFFNSLQKCSQISSNEIATKLLQLPMCYSSHKFSSLNLYTILEAYKKWQLNENASNLSMSFWFNSEFKVSKNGKVLYNIALDYIYRHEALTFLKLYDFIAFLYKDTELIQFPFTSDHNLHLTHGMRLRHFPHIPNVYGQIPSFPDETSSTEEKIKYEECIMILFQPFRTFEYLNYSKLVGPVSIISKHSASP